MIRFEYVTPKSVDEALKHLPEGTPKAGGTDLVAMMKDRLAEPKKLVNLQGLDLRKIEAGKGLLSVGALVTLADLASHPGALDGFTALAQAAGEAATPQVRNMATVGGNLCQRPRCWYFRSDQFTCRKKGGNTCPAQDGDNRYHALFGNDVCAAVHASNMGPALVALEGTIHVVGPKGERSLTAEQFFTGDADVTRENSLGEGELITGIEAPAGWKSVYLEVRERQSFDWPLVSVAVAKKGSTTRVVLGAVALKPWVAKSAKPEEIVKEAKALKHNAYKITLVKTLVERALETLK